MALMLACPCRGAVTGAVHLQQDTCTSASIEYTSNRHPADFWFFTGQPDSFCSSRSPYKICGISAAPPCSLAIAPYSTKVDACKAAGVYSNECQRSLRVFFQNFDLDCDYAVVCEYFDRPANATGVTGVPVVPSTVHINENLCNGSNYEFLTGKTPASFWYFTGTPDAYCKTHASSTLNICGVSTAPVCTEAIAPYRSKQDVCNSDSVWPYFTECKNSLRVFFQHFDVECNYLVVCEYFDGPAASVTNTTTAVLPKGTSGLAPAPLSSPSPPSPSLLPKGGDVVVAAVYAVGTAKYYCDRVSGLFTNVTLAADLYTSSLGSVSIGTYTSSNDMQVFALVNGSSAQIFAANASGATFAQTPDLLKDGGYGSLNQSYSRAIGTASLANVTYVALTGSAGGVVPNQAPCNKAPGSFIADPAWCIPFKANFTFYSNYTPPRLV